MMRSLVLVTLAALAAPAIAQQQPAQALKPITRAMFDAQMEREFGQLDADRNGTVSPTELQAAQLRAANQQAQRRAQASFQSLDTDRNGSLSPAEFAKLATVDPARLAPAPLLKFDGNKDGSVSKAEFQAGASADFIRTDTNKDGSVSQAEVQAQAPAARR